MIVLTLPYPISANRYWAAVTIPGRTMMVPSKDAKRYRKEVAGMALAAGVRKPLSGRIALSIELYPNRPQDWKTRQRKFGDSWDDTVMCIDLDNANKVLLDSLKGVAFDDDRWVRRLKSERMEPDDKGARVVIRIEQLQADQPQAPLLTQDLIDEAEVPF